MRPSPPPAETPKRDALLDGARLLRRVIEGVVPASDGGPPLAMRNLRTRLAWLIGTAAGLTLGAVVGLLLFLSWKVMPGTAPLLLGLLVGILVGCASALFVATAFRRARQRGGWRILLVPLVLLVAPLLLLAWPWTRRRRARRAPRASR